MKKYAVFLMQLVFLVPHLSLAAIVVPSQNFPLQVPRKSIANVKSPPAADENSFMVFQIINDQLVFDNSNIKSARLLENEKQFRGLIIQLKPEAINALTGLTYSSLGRSANIVFNKKIICTNVIHSPLGGSLLITGISKAEAQAFLAAMNKKKM